MLVPKRMSRNSSAFTLIELLVVIAIIGILAAMLFPVMARARDHARRTVCASGAKQVAAAAALYMQDYDEMVPLECGSNLDMSGFVTWQDTVQPYMKSYAGLICPTNPLRNPDKSDYEYWLSYGMMGRAATNGFPFWITRTAPWLQNFASAGLRYDGLAGSADLGWALYPNPAAIPSSHSATVARPAEYAFIYDAGNFDAWHGVVPGRQEGFGYCYLWVDPGKPSLGLTFTGPTPRHGASFYCDTNNRATEYGKGMANIVFFDGHVKPMSAGQFLKPNPEMPDTLRYFWPYN